MVFQLVYTVCTEFIRTLILILEKQFVKFSPKIAKDEGSQISLKYAQKYLFMLLNSTYLWHKNAFTFTLMHEVPLRFAFAFEIKKLIFNL